jgi:hypothetical protein
VAKLVVSLGSLTMLIWSGENSARMRNGVTHLALAHFSLDLALGGVISAIGTRLCRRAVQPVRDLMNPRPSNAPSEDHSRSAIVIPVGLIAQEIRGEMRLI